MPFPLVLKISIANFRSPEAFELLRFGGAGHSKISSGGRYFGAVLEIGHLLSYSLKLKLKIRTSNEKHMQDQEPANPYPPALQTVDGQGPSGKRKALVVILMVVVLAAVAFVAFWLVKNSIKDSTAEKQKKAYSQVMKQASSEEAFQKKGSDSVKDLQDYINSKPPKKYLASAYQQLGDIYMTQASFKKAADAYRGAVANYDKPPYNTVMALADAERMAGEAQQAIKDYQEAIKLMPKDDPRYQPIIKQVEAKIDDLKSEAKS